MRWLFVAAISVFPIQVRAADRVILPPMEAMKLSHQCSRISPGPVQASWTPSGAQITSLESALAVFFRKVAYDQRSFLRMPNLSDSDADKLLATYVRQYAGFVIDGKKIIYINALRGTTATDAPGWWRTKAVQICDGGPITFGVEFDPATKRFSNFAFNGAI